MLKYLIVLLDDSSVSFCYYDNKKEGKSVRKLISFEDLKTAVTFALKNNLKVNFLYPEFKLEKKYNELIEDVEHVKIIPFKSHKFYKDSILVIKSEDLNSFTSSKLKDENIILWLQYDEIKNLYSYIKKLIPKCRRINLIIQNIERFTEKDLLEYNNQIEKISGIFLKQKTDANFPEMNFLTDRLALDKMNNCDAGLKHLTIAPNGKVYICPAFYYENENNSNGEISNNLIIKNKQLLELKYAPICRICDAYQCKRCVFLNKKLTFEINTPSWQQCRISHTERETSRLFLNNLKQQNKIKKEFKDIKEIDYKDPFEIAEKNKFSISEFNNYKIYGKETD